MKTRTKWVIALAVVVSGLWLLGLFYVLSCKPDVYILPKVVVSAPSPVATPATQSTAPLLHSHPMRHTTYHATAYDSRTPYAALPPSRGLYMTSSAQVHQIGGGGANGGNLTTTTHHSSSSNHVTYSTVNVTMPTTNFVAMASQRQMAEPEAKEAPQMAMLASARRAPGPPNPTGPLPEENQLVEHPLGDALWPMMMLACLYAVSVLRRKTVKRIKS